jgi:hypothetical protein
LGTTRNQGKQSKRETDQIKLANYKPEQVQLVNVAGIFTNGTGVNFALSKHTIPSFSSKLKFYPKTCPTKPFFYSITGENILQNFF